MARLSDHQLSTDPGITLVRAEDFKEWQLDIRVLDDNPIYKGKAYRLNFRFTTNYPIGMQGFSIMLP